MIFRTENKYQIYGLTPIRQQNFMIQNKGFFLYFVGATIGRPLDSPEFYADNQ